MDWATMQRIELNYGRGRLPVDLPDQIELRVIRKRQMPVLPDPEGAVREALARPTGRAARRVPAS
jgi:hypothetical protein